MGLLVIINFTACTYYFPGNKNFFQITIRTAPDHHNQVKFNISRQYISLKNYFIKSIRVEKNNELCNIPMKKPTLIWSLYNNDKNNPVSEIPYGIKSNPPRLSANTIYLVKVTVKNKKTKQLGMRDFWGQVFIFAWENYSQP